MGVRGARVSGEVERERISVRQSLVAVAVRVMLMTGVPLALSEVAQADPPTQSSAFAEGQTLGSGSNAQAFGNISAAAAQGKVPGYGVAPVEAGYYGGGRGDTMAPGAAKVSTCGSSTPSADPIARQECEAVNFLARNPDIRPQFSISTNDAMVLKTKALRSSAEATFQSNGLYGGSSPSCTTTTNTTPAQYSTEICSDISAISTDQRCVTGRVVTIDADSNFQCDKTINAYERLTCDDSSVSCTVTGVSLQCANTSTLCASWASSCCSVAVTCNAGGSATISHSDCCGYHYTRVVSDVSEFLSGVAYNPAGARITCANSGSCSMTFENYYCSNPSSSIGHYDNVNSFNMTTSPQFACTEGGGCEGLEARTR